MQLVYGDGADIVTDGGAENAGVTRCLCKWRTPMRTASEPLRAVRRSRTRRPITRTAGRRGVAQLLMERAEAEARAEGKTPGRGRARVTGQLALPLLNPGGEASRYPGCDRGARLS